MKNKTYFLSDAHLGSVFHENSFDVERKLCRWFDAVKHDAKEIYLMGDIFDYWFEYKNVVPRGFTRVLGKLSELTDAGIPIYFFIGNHDIWLTDYLSKECGLIIEKKPIIKKIDGKVFYLAHGDGLGDESWKFKFVRKVYHNQFLRFLYAAIHPRWTMGFASTWSNYSRTNGKIEPFLGEEKEHLIQFAKEELERKPQINYFVFGHRHIMLNLPVKKESNIVILGDWMSYFSYAVFDGETMQLKQFEK
ncbi:MAG: UDP-2,3-diacylglucosamine diphosphatase [Dysgonamonadaceae bacterium]|nr:UDP-2,3-diacylglucosamine diphosphatase [Dysgonamonadaceae bacterium]